jgi:hypothetical protein
VRGLYAAARALAGQVETALAPEIQPFSPAVYESRERPGTDEIHVTIRFHDVGIDGEVLRRRVRARLKRIGIPDGQRLPGSLDVP